MGMLIQFILIMAIFFPINYLAYYITEKKGLPQWLQYKPWICRLCLTFWSLIFIYISLGLSLSCLYLGVGGVILASMNALAMWIDQKQKTVTLEDYDSIKEKEDEYEVDEVDADEYEVDCDEIEVDDDDNIVIYDNGKIIDINDYK